MQDEEAEENPKIPVSTRYTRVKDHLDFFLGQALNAIYTPLTMEQIKERLRDITEINISVKTIKRNLPRFSKKYRENLLCQIGNGYRLNHCLYRYVEIKPPKGYLKP